MHYTPDYTIQLPDGKTVDLLFNTRMFRKYSEGKGVEYEGLTELVTSGNIFRAKELPQLFICAANSYLTTNGKPSEVFTVDDVDLWIDALGGLNSIAMFDLYKIFVSKLWGTTPEQLEVMVKAKVEEPTEKKELEPA